MKRYLATSFVLLIAGLLCLLQARAQMIPMTGAGGLSKTRAATWTPASLPGLMCWFNASVGVFKDAGSTPAANGDTVQQWNNQSASGNCANLSQATALARPSYNTSGYNSRPALVFTKASNACLNSNAFNISGLNGATAASVFIVGKITTANNASDRLLSTWITGAGDTGPSAVIWWFEASTTTFSWYQTGARATETFATATNYRLGNVYSGSAITMYINNVQQAVTSYSFSFAASNYEVSVGCDDAGAENSDITICQIVMTNNSISLADRNSLDTYLVSACGS